MSAITVKITTEAAQAVAKIGTEVHLFGQPYTVYSVEGYDYYAFQTEDGTITLDTDMPRSSWLSSPVALILPEGTKIGEGFGREVRLSDLDSSKVEA
jgi:hypothetical protein